MAERRELFGIPVVVNKGVPNNEIWLVEPKRNMRDNRSDAERTTRIIVKV